MTTSRQMAFTPETVSPATAVLTDLPKRAIGIDVGGTGTKGGIVNLHKGSLTGKRFRLPTPQPATPQAVAGAIATILDELLSREKSPSPEGLAVGVTLPAVVIDNVVHTAANIADSWLGCDTTELLKDLPGRTATLNDADAAGLAEARYGAGANQPGTIITITLGTGVGSAVVHDGMLVPNAELGHLEFEGVKPAEHKVSAAARERSGMPWEEYGDLLRRFLLHVERIQAVKKFVIGGGISKRSEDFLPFVTGLRAEVVPAQLINNAGIVGAALYAAEQAALADARAAGTL